MAKSVYSLVLSDEIVQSIDEAAIKKGVSRSTLVNDVLAEYLGCYSPARRAAEIFESVAELVSAHKRMRLLSTQQTAITVASSLNYKYSPRVTYQVELFGGGEISGELKIALRTTNPILADIAAEFFNEWMKVEKKNSVCANYYVKDGKLIRSLDFNNPSITSDAAADKIMLYVKNLDKLFNRFVYDYEGGAAIKNLEMLYSEIKSEMTL